MNIGQSQDARYLLSNIEIKAVVNNFSRLKYLVELISDSPCKVLHQEDTFFNVPEGRLKLRIFSRGRGELIFYSRTDIEGPKRSEYTISKTDDPYSLKASLSFALGVRGTVRKRRFLYKVGQTRVHLDKVEELGNFIELEVVMRPEQKVSEGVAISEALMSKLEIRNEDLIEGAYIDLKEAINKQPQTKALRAAG
jgi:predicted adenylyl cyclase CyaB